MAFRKLTQFIQADVIVAMIIDELRAKNVSQFVVDTLSQATLGKGSSYKIPGIADLTVNDYSGTGFTPEDASATSQTITLDKYPFINFYLEDSDINEANALSIATEFSRKAAEQIATSMDVTVLAAINTGATQGTGTGTLGSAVAVTTGSGCLDYVESFVTQLREANVETNGAMVVPSFLGMKLAREIGVTVNNERIAGEGIELGYIDTIFGVDVYTSNNLPVTSGEFAVIGGKRDTFHLIEGMTVVKSGDAETKPATWNQFGQVYGCGFSNASGWIKGRVKKS